MPSCLIVITSWFCSDGGGAPVISTFGGTSTSRPICRIGVATMKMMSNTSTTSTSGVMLISLRTPEPPLLKATFPPRDLLAGLLVLGQEGDGGEVGVVRRLHDRPHPAEVDPLVGFDHHRAARIFVVLFFQVDRELRVDDPILADEDG